MSFQEDIDTLVEKVNDNVTIDIDTLNDESIEYAEQLVHDVTQLFEDGNLEEKHPQTAQRLKIEVETLRGLIKMRKSDEFVHDALLKAISSNNSNASLYRSLAEIQKASLSITTKINETIDIINNIMKNFQLDAVQVDNSDSSNNNEKTIYRGSKDFIKSMVSRNE